MNIQDLRQEINDEIARLPYDLEPNELYEPIRYIMNLGGKRMRPLLTLLGYYLFAEDYRKAIIPAVGMEVFHNFTLVHDDIMDQASLRRGKPTVHTKWNQNVAILSGDVMLISSYELMLKVENAHLSRVVKSFSRCGIEVCEGQQLDMNFEQLPQVSEEDYINMIRLKTAVLLGFSLELGGIIANTKEENIKLLKDFGENIGIGFQLKDDLLDVYGDADKFGKEIGGDIVANKKTYLLTQALARAEKEHLEELKHWLAQTNFDREEKVKAVTKIYDRLDMKKLTEEKMNMYFEQGLNQLASIQADESRKEVLKGFTEQLINREK